MQPANLESNIWKYTVLLITNKRIHAAILSAYYLTIPDVTAKILGLILMVGNIAGFALEIPSGYLSDKLGHKEALVVAKMSLVLSTLFFLFANSIPFLILGAVFFSIGLAFLSGTGTAFLHETLRALGKENEFTKISGKASSIGFAVPIVLTVLIPFLIEFSFKAPFVISLILDIIGLIVTLSLIKPKVTQEHIDEIGITNFKAVIKEGYRLGFFKYALFVALISAIVLCASYYRAPYQLILGIPVIWFGVLFGIGRAFASLLLFWSDGIKKYFNTTVSFFAFEIFLYFTLFLMLGATKSPILVALVYIVINAFQWGLGQINLGFMVDVIKDSKFKATLLSTQSQINNISFALMAAVMGYYIDLTSYQLAYLGLAVFLLITSLPIYFYIIKKHQPV
ncbi:MFS transporter [Candidatus Nomurabacteria bacterium]|nr:MFS transporter [Candidatus Kaiserbacteria bacterium]MCB9815491.1 MFS transporter [Candidatus Nomurabacteria bacterium]